MEMLCYIPDNFETHFYFPKVSPTGPGTLKEVLENCTKTRKIMSLDGLRVITDEPGSVCKMLISLT